MRTPPRHPWSPKRDPYDVLIWVVIVGVIVFGLTYQFVKSSACSDKGGVSIGYGRTTCIKKDAVIP